MTRTMNKSLIAVATASALADPRAFAAKQEAAAPPAPIGCEPLNLLARYSANTEGRDFVVGDLNGCYELFEQLLETLQFDRARDRMFCTGNLINHGPDSLRCLALLREPWFHAVAGNLEALLLQAASNPDSFDWPQWVGNGGAWATTLPREQLLELADEVAELPLAIVVGEELLRFNVLHAEYHGPNEMLEDELEHITTAHPVPRCVQWGRALFDGSVHMQAHEGLSATFVGHVPVEEVGRIGSHVYINTGAYLALRGARAHAHGLTAVEPMVGRVTRQVPRVALEVVKS